MMSTFDLILLGSLISLGGISFLFRAYWGPSIRARTRVTKRHEGAHRAEVLAAGRWLTIGALAFFIGYTRGADTGYLIGLWSDVIFHAVLLSGCWAATVFRINRAGGGATTSASPCAPDSTSSR